MLSVSNLTCVVREAASSMSGELAVPPQQLYQTLVIVNILNTSSTPIRTHTLVVEHFHHSQSVVVSKH